MLTRRASLILPLLALPVLIGCSDASDGPPPLSPTALAAVQPVDGVPRERVARAIDNLFADDTAGETRAVIVMRGGRVVAERYGEGYGRETRFAGWSMTKCVTGVMIGLLIADGRLRLDESAPVPTWQRSGDPRGEITLRQLLQMRSGLRSDEDRKPEHAADPVRMMFLDGRDNMATWAEAQPLEAEPGRSFEYSSASAVILADLAARALTESASPAVRRQIVADYLRTRLFDPVGMRSMVPEFDAAGTFIGSSMLHGTARDWAKFGEFLRNTGSVRGAQVIPRQWIEFMRTPSPRNPGYGAMLWLNREQVDGREVLFPGRAPRDMFGCVGHLGQYVIVSPSQRLTVVRLGKSDEPETPVVRDHLARILEAFAAG